MIDAFKTIFESAVSRFFLFQLFPLKVTTVDHLPPSNPVPSILLCHTNPLCTLYLHNVMYNVQGYRLL